MVSASDIARLAAAETEEVLELAAELAAEPSAVEAALDAAFEAELAAAIERVEADLAAEEKVTRLVRRFLRLDPPENLAEEDRIFTRLYRRIFGEDGPADKDRP